MNGPNVVVCVGAESGHGAEVVLVPGVMVPAVISRSVMNTRVKPAPVNGPPGLLGALVRLLVARE
ncbi:hypothetical protein TELCIR_05733 [Teladorsagia circumcincta]|uniref:Uncharacterized protein n=1 Tax=Teladorsagia circumcincta TaxID=45464 RepID=A0A2G9UQ04_TELCI|nr:hypothetical protein TELCIR_05733 [Teladorsagia circumcincta]